jgi:hypothetical protein
MVDGPAQRSNEFSGNRFVEIVDARDDYCFRCPNRQKPPRHFERQVFALDLSAQATDPNLIARATSRIADTAKYLARGRKIAENHAIKCHDSNQMRFS